MKNVVYIILAGCLWGIIAIFVNTLTDMGFNSLDCVAIRVSIASIILFFYLLITDKAKLKIKFKDIIYFIGTGICSIVFFTYCYFKSIEVTGGVAIPALLLYTAPIFVMILSSIFFKEKITTRKLISLLLTLLGLGFVTGAFVGNEKVSVITLVLGLGSGLGYALYSIFGKMVVDKYNSITITFYTFVVATIGVVPISGITKDIKMIFCEKGIYAAIGLGFFSTALAFLLYTKGLEGIEAGKASILATVEPFVAAIVGVICFNEKFDIPKIIGMILILFAICYLNLGTKEK